MRPGQTHFKKLTIEKTATSTAGTHPLWYPMFEQPCAPLAILSLDEAIHLSRVDAKIILFRYETMFFCSLFLSICSSSRQMIWVTYILNTHTMAWIHSLNVGRLQKTHQRHRVSILSNGRANKRHNQDVSEIYFFFGKAKYAFISIFTHFRVVHAAPIACTTCHNTTSVVFLLMANWFFMTSLV